MKEQTPKCDPCEERFEENIHQIVGEVEGYTRQDYQQKEQEVETAFENGQNADRSQQNGTSSRSQSEQKRGNEGGQRPFATSGDSESDRNTRSMGYDDDAHRPTDGDTSWSHHVVGSVQDADRTAGSEFADSLEPAERPESELKRS